MRDPMDCDSCNYPMNKKEWDKAISCSCDICNAFVVCGSCHDQIRASIESRQLSDVK